MAACVEGTREQGIVRGERASSGSSPSIGLNFLSKQANLKTAIGREQQALVEGEDGTWSASSSPLLPGLTLWTYAGVGAQAEEYRRDATTSSAAVWAVALLVAGVALFQGLRKQAPQPGTTGATGEARGTAGSTPVKGVTGSSGISGPGHLLVSSGPLPIETFY